MDKRQKSTLRSLHIKIADELILDEDFYAALRRDKIFTNGMLDIIKAEGTPRDRAYKMLELLEKRGPKAFENFVWILKENFEWLAKELEEQHNRKLQRSQQGMERNNQSSETQPKYLSNDQYPRFDQLDSNHRAVSTPNPQHRTSRHKIIPTQESVSAGFYDKNSQHYFPDPTMQIQQQQHQQQATFDRTDNLTVNVVTNDANSEPQEKRYKDACMSPIGIYESQRKTVPATSNLRSPQCCSKDETQSEADSYDQGFDEIQSQTASVTTSTNDDIESQLTSTTEIQSETGAENDDAVDAPVYEGLDENDAYFPTSEVYYDCVRRGSSQISQFDDEVFQHELGIPDDENDVTRSELSYEQSEAFQNQMEEMRELFIKLTAITSENDDTEDLEDDFVNWDMINTETDKLINRLENSDDTKIIRKCYELFPEKERKQPLNVCIERLFADKKEIENRLKEKQKEMDQMVFDLWKHQQDMSNIKKLRKTLADKEIENNNLKTSLDNLEKDADIKLKWIEEKEAKIKELESRHLEQTSDLQRKPGATTKRGPYSQRRVPNTQGQSPRRQSSYGDPRMSLMQGAYAQQSPRNVTTAMRRAPTNRK